MGPQMAGGVNRDEAGLESKCGPVSLLITILCFLRYICAGLLLLWSHFKAQPYQVAQAVLSAFTYNSLCCMRMAERQHLFPLGHQVMQPPVCPNPVRDTIRLCPRECMDHDCTQRLHTIFACRNITGGFSETSNLGASFDDR